MTQRIDDFIHSKYKQQTTRASGWKALVAGAFLGMASLVSTTPDVSAQTLLNVSYDPTRELYR